MFIFSTNVLGVGICLFFCTLCLPSSGQIIISQYYEGIVNDKFLEITNVSGSPLNPDNNEFFICVFSNEEAVNPSGKKPGLSTRIEAALLPGETIIYKNPLAASPTYAVDEGIGALVGAYNGNDIIVIATTKDETAWENRVDVIGESGFWGVDISFYRKTTVSSPNPNFTPDEWVEVSLANVNNAGENTLERLGYHFYNCQLPTLASSNIIFAGVTDTSLDIQWDPGNGSGRLAIAKANEAITALPVGGLSYTANATYGAGEAFDGGFVVYNGWGNAFSLAGLAPATRYFISIFETGCSPPQYLTADFAEGNEVTLAPIPKILTNLGEEGLDFGIVRPGNDSQVSEISASWINLSSEITANVVAPFKISADQGNWSDQIVIPFSESGTSTMFIRFSPDKPDGIHQKALTLSSSGAADVSRPLLGTVFPNAWINEFHYEDMGADDNEFVEIALQNAEKYELSAINLQCYDGNSGTVYKQESIDNFMTGEKANSFTLFYWPTSGIQNGQPDGPDGLALGINEELILLLSYEGVFTANDGIAAGTLSVDIGVEESDETIEGMSLQLQNDDLAGGDQLFSGNSYEDFVWTTGLQSPGLLNGNQILPVVWHHFNAVSNENSAVLTWQTLSEKNNEGFEVLKSFEGDQFEKIGYVPGHGNSNEPLTYHFTDNEFFKSCYYKLKQIDFDGRFDFSHVITLKRPRSVAKVFHIGPNPVKQKLHITVSAGVQTGSVEVQLLSIQGKKILESRGDLVKLMNEINHRLRYLQKGFYLLKLRSGWLSEKHILLKE